MSYLLDTNTVSYFLRDQSPALTARLMDKAPDALAISVVTSGELQFGLKKLGPGFRTTALSMRLDKLLQAIATSPIPAQAAAHYGHIRAHLEGKGTPIGSNDLWIAAHAMAEDLTLVTHNLSEFERVPGLRVESWL
jgi:tRNA(fMet)-specific endonuclease VapC